jgi:hypothetical protein
LPEVLFSVMESRAGAAVFVSTRDSNLTLLEMGGRTAIREAAVAGVAVRDKSVVEPAAVMIGDSVAVLELIGSGNGSLDVELVMGSKTRFCSALE